jgi:hypothetical protein
VQQHSDRHVIDHPEVALALEPGTGQVFEMAGKQRRVAPHDIAHRHPVAGVDVGKLDNLQACVLEHRGVNRGGLLLVADLMRLHGEPASVGLLGMRFDGDDVVERLVVADLVPGVVVQCIVLGDAPGLFDREQVGATGFNHKVAYVALDARITRACRLQPE